MVASGMTKLRVISNPALDAFEVPTHSMSANARLRIMCATDLWGHSDQALQKALWLAETTDAELLLVHVVDGEIPLRLRGRRADHARSALEWRLRRWPDFRPRPEISVPVGNPHRTISRVAREWRANFVVLGSSRHGTRNRFFATTAERVASEAQRAVLVVNRDAKAYARVAVVATSHPRAVALEEAGIRFRILKHNTKPCDFLLVQPSRASHMPNVTSFDHHRRRRIRVHSSVADVTQAVLREPPELVILVADRWPTLAGPFRRSATSILARSTEMDLLIQPAI